MNLITCSKNCVHQHDGYCKLEHTSYVNQYKVDGCCYYQKAGCSPAPQKNSAKKSASPFIR